MPFEPVILFFLLGLLAGLARSDLKIPAVLYESLSIFLLLAIGLKGGVELAREIGQRHPGLPVILLTTFDDDAVVRGAVDAGVAGFLLKDSSTDDLVAAIGSAQSGGLVLDPRIARAAVTPAPVVSDPLAALTPGEHAVAELVAEGATNQEIAQRLFIAEGTVKNHVSALLRKLDQRDRTGLALFLSRTRPPRR